ncbi:MAG: hypothetical protein ACON5K_11975 [Bacteroidia bacterium]
MPSGIGKPNSQTDELFVKGYTSSHIRNISAVLKEAENISFQGQQSNDMKTYHQLVDTNFLSKKDIWYLSPDLKGNSVFTNILNQEDWKLVHTYLGPKGYLKRCHIYWSLPQDENDLHQYGWHYDIDDYRFVKLFVYLSDVGEENGPHEIFTTVGSRFFRFFHRRVSHGLLTKKYGSDCVLSLTGLKGTSFWEDTFLYHRGKLPKKPRCILQFEFGISSDFSC